MMPGIMIGDYLMEYKIVSQYEDTPRIAIHETEQPVFEARLVINLLERWGLVAAESDGEDSAGREAAPLDTERTR